MDSSVLVSIRCLVYNHEPYLRQCLDGFVMQKTNFKFEAIVHDDASTDNSAAIIREYANKYPDIIVPIFEQENQYSKHDGSLSKIMNEHMRGKYVAICEGDDYWIDPYKLQKQVDFMDDASDYSLCFHANYILNQNIIHEIHRYNYDNFNCSIEDMILMGGEYMATSSILVRSDIFKVDISNLKWYNISPAGDNVLMLLSALNGKVAYFDELMSVYRCLSGPLSWSSKINKSFLFRCSHFVKTFKVYYFFNKDTDYAYSKVIHKRMFILLKGFFSRELKRLMSNIRNK